MLVGVGNIAPLHNETESAIFVSLMSSLLPKDLLSELILRLKLGDNF